MRRISYLRFFLSWQIIVECLPQMPAIMYLLRVFSNLCSKKSRDNFGGLSPAQSKLTLSGILTGASDKGCTFSLCEHGALIKTLCRYSPLVQAIATAQTAAPRLRNSLAQVSMVAPLVITSSTSMIRSPIQSSRGDRPN